MVDDVRLEGRPFDPTTNNNRREKEQDNERSVSNIAAEKDRHLFTVRLKTNEKSANKNQQRIFAQPSFSQKISGGGGEGGGNGRILSSARCVERHVESSNECPS